MLKIQVLWWLTPSVCLSGFVFYRFVFYGGVSLWERDIVVRMYAPTNAPHACLLDMTDMTGYVAVGFRVTLLTIRGIATTHPRMTRRHELCNSHSLRCFFKLYSSC